MAALDAVLDAAGLPARTLSALHRGVTLEVGGWPLDVGIAIQRGVLRAQGELLGPGQVDAHELLHDHRQLAFVRFSHSDGGAVWVEAEVPLAAATEPLIDAMLGALVEAAELGRRRAQRPVLGRLVTPLPGPGLLRLVVDRPQSRAARLS